MKNVISALKKFGGKISSKALAIGLSISTAIAMGIATCATDVDAVDEMNTAVSGALSSFSVANLAKVIVAGLAIAVPLVLAWFAFRWVYRKAKGGLKSGR